MFYGWSNGAPLVPLIFLNEGLLQAQDLYRLSSKTPFNMMATESEYICHHSLLIVPTFVEICKSNVIPYKLSAFLLYSGIASFPIEIQQKPALGNVAPKAGMYKHLIRLKE